MTKVINIIFENRKKDLVKVYQNIKDLDHLIMLMEYAQIGIKGLLT